MFKLIKLVLIISVVAAGWYLLSPLFIDKEVDEDLDPKVAAALDFVLEKTGEGIQKAGEKIADTDAEDIQKNIAKLKESMDDGTNLSEQIKEKDEMNEFMEEMSEMQDVEISEDMAASDEPTVLATGSFVTVAHEGTGSVQVINLGNKHGTIVRLEDVDVLNGPDLRVLLSKSSDVEKAGHLGDYVQLGKLKGNKGNQNYLVPVDVNIQEYHSVVIYCAPFKVVFNSANLVQ